MRNKVKYYCKILSQTFRKKITIMSNKEVIGRYSLVVKQPHEEKVAMVRYKKSHCKPSHISEKQSNNENKAEITR